MFVALRLCDFPVCLLRRGNKANLVFDCVVEDGLGIVGKQAHIHVRCPTRFGNHISGM